MRLVTPPERPTHAERPWLFLAGAIDMGAAEDWQSKAVKALAGFYGTVFNPRRPDWDATWNQTKCDPRMMDQINWELEMLDAVDLIMLWIPGTAKAPIALMELGLHARSGKLIVGCEEAFYRYENVRVTCYRHQVPLYHGLETTQNFVLDRLSRLPQR
ncbi:MAG: hypothetical protein BWY85_00167 [Firmicutes bacterium ADurb.Bin506]|nr:MAG: hypothetical protein BWY85_00167 [Firmicutes bacterium ADurb.Bin506]